MEDVVTAPMANALAVDLERALAQAPATWEELRGARIFVTGGTGFIGSWLLETLLWANDRLSLGASVVVLTRDGHAFTRGTPHLANHPCVAVAEGDVRVLDGSLGAFTHVVHGAFSSGSALDPRTTFDTIVDGTRRTLEFARRAGARRFLFTSSGAVYGPQPATLSHISEDYPGGPDAADPGQAYAEGKRAAEMLCAVYADQQLEPAIARCFALVGPYLPVDAHFAAGNFVRDALKGGPIEVAGDGTAVRSYLYASDLAVWLWTILLRGTPLQPYNVGSEEAISIADLARTVAGLFTPPREVRIAKVPPPGATPHRYVPSTRRARSGLGLQATVGLEHGLARTLEWHRRHVSSSHA
jgi:nucleoside-diphosphate-sugar epimerase